jgi:hypothetical protein
MKPYMFRSLLYDHPQRSFFVLSALPLLRLFASSVGCLVVSSRPDIPQTGTPGAHTHTHKHTHTQTTYSHIPNKQLDEANKRRSGNALSTKDDP